jgi:hypothetical protein
MKKCSINKWLDNEYRSIGIRSNIIILAIAHQHRKPGYWIDGIKREKKGADT